MTLTTLADVRALSQAGGFLRVKSKTQRSAPPSLRSHSIFLSYSPQEVIRKRKQTKASANQAAAATKMLMIVYPARCVMTASRIRVIVAATAM
jgi:hypothetical protein